MKFGIFNKRSQFLLLFLFSIIFFQAAYATSAITGTGGGRLGDKLVNFIKTFYYAQKLGLAFIYPIIPNADKFMFSTLSNKEVPYKACRYVLQQELDSPKFKVEDNTLYMLQYTAHDGNFISNIRDEKIKKSIKKLLAPRIKLKKFSLPKDCITVAVHVRKGSGTDIPPIADLEQPIIIDSKKKPSDMIWPTKFPPDNFYITQIKLLSEIFNNQPLYVFLFTDNKDPEKLVAKYQAVIQNPSISLDCRRGTNAYDDTMIEDFFALSQFDCLIRPDSGFSRVPEFIGDHAVVIAAEHAIWHENTLVVDKTSIKIKKPTCNGITLNLQNLEDKLEGYEIRQDF